MVLKDFLCDACAHRFEEWDNSDGNASPPCPNCEETNTHSVISPVRLDYTGMAMSDSNQTSVDKWAKARKQKKAIEQRNMERHGTYD